jgi:lysophospholipase L1-like esterase
VALLVAELGLRGFDVPPSPLAPLHVPSYRRSENPILRYTYRPNLAADHAGYDAMHRGLATNARGFRDLEFALPKPPGVLRILAIGDSTTMGLGIPELENTYPKWLERRLRESGRRIEVLNLGVGGYDPEQAAELLRVEAKDLEPDLVLLLVCLNDLSRGVDGGVEAALDRAHAHLEPPASGALRALWRRSRLVFFLQNRLRAFSPEAAPAQRERGPTPLELGLAALSRWSEAEGVPALAFLLPGLDGTFSRYAHGDVHHEMARIAGSVPGVAWIDLLPAFRAVQDESRILSFDGLHPNRVGSRLLVELMVQELERRGLP